MTRESVVRVGAKRGEVVHQVHGAVLWVRCGEVICLEGRCDEGGYIRCKVRCDGWGEVRWGPHLSGPAVRNVAPTPWIQPHHKNHNIGGGSGVGGVAKAFGGVARRGAAQGVRDRETVQGGTALHCKQNALVVH